VSVNLATPPAPPSTPAQREVEEMLALWLYRLNLPHWRVKMNWDEPPLEGSDADACANEFYDEATIRLKPEFTTWSTERIEEVIVHELVHLHVRDLVQAVDSIEPHVKTASAWKVFQHRFVHEQEGLVDRLAVVMVAHVRRERSTA
jgi:hypothetical protein